MHVSDWRQLIGRPYAPSGQHPQPPDTFDCYTLVTYVRDVIYLTKTPLLVDPAFVDVSQVAQLVELHLNREIYVPVTDPRPGDIAKFNQHHIGVVVDGGVLAAFRTADAGQVYWLDWPKMRKFYSDTVIVRLA